VGGVACQVLVQEGFEKQGKINTGSSKYWQNGWVAPGQWK